MTACDRQIIDCIVLLPKVVPNTVDLANNRWSLLRFKDSRKIRVARLVQVLIRYEFETNRILAQTNKDFLRLRAHPVIAVLTAHAKKTSSARVFSFWG